MQDGCRDKGWQSTHHVGEFSLIGTDGLMTFMGQTYSDFSQYIGVVDNCNTAETVLILTVAASEHFIKIHKTRCKYSEGIVNLRIFATYKTWIPKIRNYHPIHD